MKDHPTPHTATFTVTDFETAQSLSNMLEGIVDSLTFFEAPQGWQVTVNDTVESAQTLEQRLLNSTQPLLIPLKNLTCGPTPQIDWLVENRRAFPPISVGDFFIYSSFYEDTLPTDRHGIKLDAATAFGSGEHPTTAGCLEAMTDLYRHGFRPQKILDMGCGSGLLALGAAKLWRVPVLAVDNDPEAVRVSQENTANNGVETYVTCALSDGYDPCIVTKPYDLIIANILANPLCEMAGALAENLQPLGHAILSGILNAQAPSVIEAHAAKKLFLVDQIVRGDWSILHLKPGFC